MNFALKKGLPRSLWAPYVSTAFDREELPGPTVLKDESDERLFKLFQSGHVPAFEGLLSRYQKPLFNFIYRFTRNLQTTEEAFQEIFLRVIRSADEYRSSTKFATWLYAIARNYCIDLKRRGFFRNHVSLDQGEGGGVEFASEGHSAEGELGCRDIKTRLIEILDSLVFEQKEVFVMREFQGLTFDEIARIVGVSVNTIKSRMRYAVQFIRKKFLELGLDPKGVL